MSYKLGYQELEQRDEADNIVKPGVVSKKSPFSTADNTGIYDVLAENFRVLAERLSEVETSNNLSTIRDDVQKMYNDMRTNEKFGSVEATAQAKIATDQATLVTEKVKQVMSILDSITAAQKDTSNTLANADADLAKVKEYLADIAKIQKGIEDNAQVSINQCTFSKKYADNAKVSEDNAQKWAESADSPDGAEDLDAKTGKSASSKSWAMSSKASSEAAFLSETNAKASENAAAVSAKASADQAAVAVEKAAGATKDASSSNESSINAKTSESNAKMSEDNAKMSETNAKASENSATSQANAAKQSAIAAAASEKATASSASYADKAATTASGYADSCSLAAKSSNVSASAAKMSEDNAKMSETNAKASENAAAVSAKASADQAAESLENNNSAKQWAEGIIPDEKIVSSADGGKETIVVHFSSKAWAGKAETSASNAKASEVNAKASENASESANEASSNNASNAKASETKAKESEMNAKASEVASAASSKEASLNSDQSKGNAILAQKWAESADSPDGSFDSVHPSGKSQSSKTWATMSKDNAGAAESKAAEAKSYAEAIKDSMNVATQIEQDIKTLQGRINELNAQAQQYVADAKNIRNSISDVVCYKGSKDNFSDLPTLDQKVGEMWNVVNVDKTHGINAGDNVIWNGTDWDNMGSFIDVTTLAVVNTDVAFKTVSGSFIGDLKGNAESATIAASAKSVDWANILRAPTSLPANGGIADIAKSANICTGNSATASRAATADSVDWGGVTGKPSVFAPAVHTHDGGQYRAAEGTTGGFSFANEGSYDTGMFSNSDGDLYFMQNGIKWYASHDGHNHDNSYPSTTGGRASGTWGINVTGSSGYAGHAGYVDNDAAQMRFHWNGQGGQPSWLWGGSDASNMYVYNPSNFSVNYSNTTGRANNIPTSDIGGNIWIG